MGGVARARTSLLDTRPTAKTLCSQGMLLLHYMFCLPSYSTSRCNTAAHSLCAWWRQPARSYTHAFEATIRFAIGWKAPSSCIRKDIPRAMHTGSRGGAIQMQGTREQNFLGQGTGWVGITSAVD